MATNAGIVTDDNSGERHIPESVRADGSTRRAIKIRPGYRPPEDVEVYKNRTAESFRQRGSKMGIPGAVALQEEQASSASSKNAKRREARKRAKAAADDDGDGAAAAQEGKPDAQPPKTEEVDPHVERDRKARNLRKKLKQARDLQGKRDGGETLLPEQIAKVIKINELVRELHGLGFNDDQEHGGTASDEAQSHDQGAPNT